jgi:hypothetical protein
MVAVLAQWDKDLLAGVESEATHHIHPAAAVALVAREQRVLVAAVAQVDPVQFGMRALQKQLLNR